LAVIRYHASWPSSTDRYYTYNSSENTARISYYPPDTDGNYYTPYMWIDGDVRGNNQGNWRTQIASEKAVSAPLDIQLGGTYNSATRTGNLTIRIIATGAISYSDLKLRLATTESDLHYTAPNGTTVHDQTFRDMFPNTTGLTVTIALGETLTFNQAFSYPRPLIEKNCTIVAFVQSQASRRILQGAKITLNQLDYQILSFGLIAPANGDTVYGCQPNFVWHRSIDSLSFDTVFYQVQFSRDPAFPTPFISDTLRDTSWLCPVCIDYNTTYYWRVQAFSALSEPRFSTQTFSLYTKHPCPYILGDINGDRAVIGGDVTFGVRYFKSVGSVPPDSCYLDSTATYLYVAGDANGNCEFRGSDITRLVAYFKGTAVMTPCPALSPTPIPLLKKTQANNIF
jgi:hypothetical protein